MTVEYSVLIKRGENHKIIGYYYPDFDYEHSCVGHDLLEDIDFILAEHVKGISASEMIPFPKKLMHYKKIISIDNMDSWTLCQLDPFFIQKTERYLPSFGVFTSVIAAVSMAIVNFYSTKKSMNSQTGIWIGSVGSILSAIMAIIIYFFSDANEISKIIGRKVDDFIFQKKQGVNIQLRNPLNYSTLIPKIFLTFIPIATTIYSSYNHYNQVIAVIGNSNDRSAEAFKYISLVMIIFSSYSKLIFQLSFMPPLYSKLDNCAYTKISRNYHPIGLFEKNGGEPVEYIALHEISYPDEEDVVMLNTTP